MSRLCCPAAARDQGTEMFAALTRQDLFCWYLCERKVR